MDDPFKRNESRNNGLAELGKLKWFFIFMTIGVGFAFFIPFPLSLFALIGFIVIVDLFRARRALKKAGMLGGFTELFRSLSSGGPLKAFEQSPPLNYYCMQCGKENNNIECVFCGSKMKRVG